MKNKTKTYLLIAAVLGIWGTIGYKIINGLNPDEPTIAQQNFENSFNPKQEQPIDTFSIQEVDQDPFLGTLSTTKKTKKSSSQNSTIKKPLANLPTITFEGVIKKQNSSNPVFVVTINNKQYLLKKGQVANSVTLVKGNSKEIVVLYENKRQTIKRR